MIRTQVQLTGEQMAALRQVSTSTGRSVADLVRQGVDQYLSGCRGPAPKERIARAIRVAGMFSSGAKDVSTRHDRYLANAFQT
jgi:hypothetical protein